MILRTLPLTAVGALALANPPAYAATLGQAGAPDLHLGRVILVFVLCCALAIGAAVIIKRNAKGGFGQGLPLTRWVGRSDDAGVRVLEARRLGMHAEICRLTCAGREYLVIVSPGGATLLREAEASAPVEAQTP